MSFDVLAEAASRPRLCGRAEGSSGLCCQQGYNGEKDFIFVLWPAEASSADILRGFVPGSKQTRALKQRGREGGRERASARGSGRKKGGEVGVMLLRPRNPAAQRSFDVFSQAAIKPRLCVKK